MKRLALLCALFAILPAAMAAIPVVQSFHTDNGVRVVFVESHELPMVDLRMSFAAGSARDGAKPGQAKFTSLLLGQGAGGKSADAISDAFAALGAQFDQSVDRDIGSLSLRSLSDARSLDAAAAIFNLLLTRPDFPQDAVARVRDQLLVAIRNRQDDPERVALDALLAAAYDGHPYGHAGDGTTVSVSALNRADAQAFFRHYSRTSDAVLALVGDLSLKQARRLADVVTKGMETGAPPPSLPPAPKLSTGTPPRSIAIDYRSSQTHVMIGTPAVAWGDPQYPALLVGNQILGGGTLVSRLFAEVREKRGLSYHASSMLLPLKQSGPFIAMLGTRNDQADQALAVLRSTVDAFLKKGPTDQEVAAAKRNLTGGFALQIDSNKKILDLISDIGFYRLPLDYLDRFVPAVKAVTAADVRRAFTSHIDPRQFVTVRVGGGQAHASAPAGP
jgi:zinc protease